MTDDIKPNKFWNISLEEAEQATIEKCAHLHVSYRHGFTSDEGAVTIGWWECDAGCGTRFIPIEVVDMSFVEYFQGNIEGTGGKP